MKSYNSVEEILADGKDTVSKTNEGIVIIGPIGEEIVAAKDLSELPPEIVNVPQSDAFLLDLFTWTGSQEVADGAFQDYFALPGITKSPGGTANLILTAGNLKFPARVKPTQVIFNVRITGTIAGGAGTAREWRTQTRRTDGTTLIGSAGAVKVQGVDISNRDATLISYTLGTEDPFSVTGVQLGIFNVSGQIITLTGVTARMMQIVNPT